MSKESWGPSGRYFFILNHHTKYQWRIQGRKTGSPRVSGARGGGGGGGGGPPLQRGPFPPPPPPPSQGLDPAVSTACSI